MRVILLFLCLIIAAPARAGVEESWTNALVLTPWAPTPARINAMPQPPPDTRVPVVVFIHGCTRLYTQSTQVTKLATRLAQNGYAVIAPDSFIGRGMDYCDPKTKNAGGLNAQTLQWRIDEAHYARQQVRRLPWAADFVVLIGHSMGGFTVARYVHEDYSAYVSLGWHCLTRPGTDLAGHAGWRTKSRPSLAVLGTQDEWLMAANSNSRGFDAYRMNCAAMGGSMQNVVLRGATHSVFENEKLFPILFDFLDRARR